MIHTTIGIYSDGSYKTNGVPSEYLQEHINYNLKYRPGRAFIVDGEIIHKGNLSDKLINERLKNLKKIKEILDTAPYH